MATSQFSAPGKVYVITQAITGDVSVGNGSTLVFQGGTISNGRITGNNVTLCFNTIAPTFSNVTFSGKFNCDHFYPELFGARGDGKSDDSGAIQRCIDAAYSSRVFVVRFLPKTYMIASTVYVKANVKLQGSSPSNLYRYNDTTTILANLSNPNGFALDTDIYQPSNVKLNSKNRVVSMSNSGKRFDMFHRVQNSTSPVYDPSFPDDPYYGGPYFVSDIALSTTNDTFGGLREIGMIHAHISGVVIHGFRLGMYLAKGWNFVVERCSIRTSMFGMALGAELTDGLFNSVQVCCTETSPKNADSTRKFYSAMVEGLLNEYSTVFKGSNMRTVGIIGNQTSATFNACCIERYQIGLYGYALQLVFNTPYIEYNKESIICLSKGTIQLNNSAGVQEATTGYGYIALNVLSTIILNNAHPGSFYPTVADESYNKDYYNVKSYVVTNHNKVHRRMTYSASTYVDCNVGDTVYVCDTHHTTDAALAKKENALMPSNLGNYFMHPITMKDAINRIASDYNYRNVKRIVLVGDVALKESLNWCCDHPLEVVRDRKVKRLTINAKQNISCDVTFKKLNITLNSALCQTQRKECVNLSFEEDTITGNGFIVENTAQQESPSAVVYLSFDKQSTFASRKYFSDNSSQKPAAAYHVMVAGKQVSSISGATAARPADALYTGYCYFDTMLNKPIWWNGRNWVDSLGNSVDSSRYK